MEPDFIQQPGEIPQAIRLIQRAPWFHAPNLNRVVASRKCSPLLEAVAPATIDQ
jgi:hypothetical protein